MYELYKNIKKYRIMQGWSQEELAKKAGYTDRSSIAKIEKGDVDLPQSKIIQFSKIFNVTPGELLGDDGVSPEEEYTLPIRAAARNMMNMSEVDQEIISNMIKAYKDSKKGN